MREQYQARLVAWNPANIRNTGCLGNLKTFKNSGRGWDSLYCKKVKVKVSLFTFNFCCVNCCNTSQLLLLTGSRLLKLLLTTKCISTRIFVCLFLFNFLLLQKKKFQHHLVFSFGRISLGYHRPLYRCYCHKYWSMWYFRNFCFRVLYLCIHALSYF